jgi:hypothetical protein
MKRILLITFAVYILATPPAFGCTCVEYRLTRRAFRSASAVFIGTPIESSFIRRNEEDDDDSKGPSLFFTKVRFKVERSWKGVTASEIIIISDGALEPSGYPCGFQFVKGERYLVYANGSRLKAATSCERDIKRLKDDEASRKTLKQLDSFWFRMYARLNRF